MTERTDAPRRIEGYRSDPMRLARNSLERERNRQTCSSASSIRPVAAPAFTICTVNRSKGAPGAFFIASDSEFPARTSPRIAAAASPMALPRNNSESISRLRSTGTPATSKVRSPWRNGRRSRFVPLLRNPREAAAGAVFPAGVAAGHTRIGRYPISRSRSVAPRSSGASTIPSETRPSRSAARYPNTAIALAPWELPGKRVASRAARHPEHFLDRGEPPPGLVPAVLPQKHHPAGYGARPDGPRVGAGQDQVLDLLVDGEQLEDPQTAAVPGPPAGVAPLADPQAPFGGEPGLPEDLLSEG